MLTQTQPQLRDVRVASIVPVNSPAFLLHKLPLSERGAATVHAGRNAVIGILNGEDDRLVVVVGPCSIHDAVAGYEYAQRLGALAKELQDDLCVVMRVYFEKPRTTVGWKGLINDPHLDGSVAIDDGLRIARKLLIDIAELGLPAGCEFLDPISPQYTSDLVTWGAIGARTTESQTHRELASGLSMPIGFKNGTDGGVQVAVDAMLAAAHPHSFLGITEQGLAAIVNTTGNRDCHIILRGGRSGANYDAESVSDATRVLAKSGLPARIMIDASHGNSNKDFRRQPVVTEAICEQVAAGNQALVGVMIESFLVEGRQDRVDGCELTYGQSITDACIGWDSTEPALHQLAEAVRKRRAQ